MSDTHQLPADGKSLSGLAWTWIACGIIALILLGIGVGMKVVGPYLKNREKRDAVELIVQASSDLGKISANDFAGQMELGSNSGARYQVSYDDLLSGRFSYLDSQGNMTTLGSDFSTVPEWAPKILDTIAAPAVSHSKIGGKVKGSYSTLTRIPGAAIHKSISGELAAQGFVEPITPGPRRMTCCGPQIRTTKLKCDTADQEISVTTTDWGSSPTHVEVLYEEK